MPHCWLKQCKGLFFSFFLGIDNILDYFPLFLVLFGFVLTSVYYPLILSRWIIRGGWEQVPRGNYLIFHCRVSGTHSSERPNDWESMVLFFVLSKIHSESYMSVRVLLNLLNELRKKDKMWGFAEHFTPFLQ